MVEWYLRGLSGCNPLAFLASLGTLRSASLAWPQNHVTMQWRRTDGNWRPYLRIDKELESDALIPTLQEQLHQMVGHPAFCFAKDLKLEARDFRKVALDAKGQARLDDRRFADFIASLACDTTVIGQGNTQIQDTALRTISGVGNQHFIGFMADLAEKTTKGHLSAALFSEWRYQDLGLSLRWDPFDDRRHALRWKKPTTDRPRTVWGGNRLAIEGLPLLPVMPRGSRLRTTGFSQRLSSGTFWTWPIWEGELNLDVVRSLLALGELQQIQPPRERLRAMGIVEIYRSQRISRDKYRNFTPAVPV